MRQLVQPSKCPHWFTSHSCLCHADPSG